MQTYKKLLFLLSSHERKNAGLLLIMIIVMALLDMVGVASILPFITVLTNPSLVETNFILSNMFQISKIFGVEDNQQFLFALGFLVFLLLIFSLVFKVLTTYAQLRFVQMREYSIGKRLLEGYLNQPYSWFLSRNSSDLGKTILSEVGEVIENGIKPLIELISKGIVAAALIILLILADPKLAFIIGLSLSIAYLLIFYFVKNYLKRIGQQRLVNNQLRFSVISEGFGAIKEIKVGGLEKICIKIFSNSAKIFASTQVYLQVVALLPRHILEAIAFSGILLIIFYIMTQTGNFNTALPVVSLYVFAGYRLMPALQGVYDSFTKLTFVISSLTRLYDDLKSLKLFDQNQNQEILPLNKKITLKNIYYNYPNSSIIALKDISLTVPARSIVGFVGATGSGKTTLVDVILGLLEPQKGNLEVDGKVITSKNSRSWQRSIGYVPQHIYLLDDTVAANIAFGVETNYINEDMLEKASKIANLHEFVINELPRKYQTIIGERGVRLSGGQRQRIGIARALYHNPQVLILDEATNALDNQTEQLVMNAISNLSKKITIILIAHRLNTLKNCLTIFKLDKGQLINQGTFEELIKNNIDFATSKKNN
jgi:ABC-type multidrug transport system fused ATPase/permease subunit